MCLCNMPGKISIYVIINASGKADTMVEYFFVPRGSGLTPVATPVFIFRDQAMGGFCFGHAPKAFIMHSTYSKRLGGEQLIHHIKYW